MPTFTATAAPAKKAGHRTITVTKDGEVWDTRTTKAGYEFVLIQGWDGLADQFAPRYSSTAKPLGTKIEYGKVVAVVPIIDAA